MSRKLFVFNKFLFAICLVSITLILTFFDYINYFLKVFHPLPNWVDFLLLVSVTFFVMYLFIFLRKKHHLFKSLFLWINKNFKNILIVISILLFVLQVIIAWNFYFKTDWDVSIVFDFANTLEKNDLHQWYFSAYPNNLLLTYIFSIIIKFANFVGMDPYFGIIVIGSLLVNISGIITALVLNDYSKNKALALLSLCTFIPWVALSPWIVIPYSDIYGIIFPILILYLYIKVKQSNASNYFRIFMIGFLSAVGYLIKASAIIVLIAIIITEIFELISNQPRNKRAITNNIFLLICSVVLVFASFSILKTSFGLNEERNFGPTHYIMMGLNAERSGVFEEEDVLYSNSFQTKAERQRANVQVIKERLNNYGPLGFIKLLVNKALINFNDGSFAWEVEGNFYKELLPDNNKIFAPIFMNYYSSYEDYDNTVFKQIVQSLWLWVLIFSLGFIIPLQKNNLIYFSIDNVVYLSIIGFVLFVMIFEARARYLFVFAPIFIICAFIGLKRTYHYLLKFFHWSNNKR